MAKILRNQVMMSTSRDRHGECFTAEQLRICFEQMKAEELMTVEHDPAQPPFAKSLNKRLVHEEDGEWTIRADIEVYDEERLAACGGYSVTVKCGGRRFVEKEPVLEIMFNPLVIDEEPILQLCQELATDELPIDAIYLKQKSAELPLVIFAAFTFIGGSIAAGFLSEIGKDIYVQLKKRLAKLCRSAEEQDEHDRACECRITFRVERERGSIEIYTSVNADDLDWMVENGLTTDDIERKIGDLALIDDVKSATLRLDRGQAVWDVEMVIKHNDEVVVRPS